MGHLHNYLCFLFNLSDQIRRPIWHLIFVQKLVEMRHSLYCLCLLEFPSSPTCSSDRRRAPPAVAFRHLFPVPSHGPVYGGFNGDANAVGQLNSQMPRPISHLSTIRLGPSKKCSYDDNYYCYCSNLVEILSRGSDYLFY